jgi:hypothetical protein
VYDKSRKRSKIWDGFVWNCISDGLPWRCENGGERGSKEGGAGREACETAAGRMNVSSFAFALIDLITGTVLLGDSASAGSPDTPISP